MTADILEKEIAVQDSVSSNYEKIRYSKSYSTRYQDVWYEDMVSLIGRKGLVLDNGCGVGHLANFIPNNSLVGLDISKKMLDNAKSRIHSLVRGNSQELPFKNDTFDVIICRSLLHHLPEPGKGLGEIHRVLKPGGEVILAEPIESCISYIPRKLIGKEGHFSEVHTDFKRAAIISLIEKEFSIEKIEHFGYFAYPILGFPDIVDPLRVMPFQNAISTFLIHIDQVGRKIPFLNRQSWGIIIKGRKFR